MRYSMEMALVEQLRQLCDPRVNNPFRITCTTAADAIERLAAELDALDADTDRMDSAIARLHADVATAEAERDATLTKVPPEVKGLVERLLNAARILRDHPCEVVWLERDCREAAAALASLEMAWAERDKTDYRVGVNLAIGTEIEITALETERDAALAEVETLRERLRGFEFEIVK